MKAQKQKSNAPKKRPLPESTPCLAKRIFAACLILLSLLPMQACDVFNEYLPWEKKKEAKKEEERLIGCTIVAIICVQQASGDPGAESMCGLNQRKCLGESVF